jgi:HAD superfamily hydrolase (TIGR01490 family)
VDEPRAAAYFDFDRTVHDGDAGVLFGKELLRIRRRRLRDEARGTLGWLGRNVAFEAWLGRLYAEATVLRLASDARLVKRSRLLRKVYTMMRGLRLDDLRGLANDFVDEVVSQRLFPQALQEMQAHRQAGRTVIVVSTGMRLLIEPIKRHLPIDDVIAVDLVAPDGLLSGEVRGPLWGQEKADAVREYAHRRGLSLPRSYAYSDHRSDLPFLRLVGHPVAVNPDLALGWHARRRGWPVQKWRRPPA